MIHKYNYYFKLPSVIVNPRADTQLSTDLTKQSKTFPPFKEAATAKKWLSKYGKYSTPSNLTISNYTTNYNKDYPKH